MRKILRWQDDARKNRLKIKHFSSIQQTYPQSYPQLVDAQRGSNFSPEKCGLRCFLRPTIYLNPG
jgi:hypothetical protein